MAVACAVGELLRRRSLNVDLVMLIEGEEESGSRGFREAVQKNKVRGLDISTHVKLFDRMASRI